MRVNNIHIKNQSHALSYISIYNNHTLVALLEIVKIGIFKCGNIGVSPIFELLLDELAQREDITVRTVTTGSKMGVKDVEEALPKLFEFDPDLIVFISPNPAIPGPATVREILLKKGVPSIVISDGVAKRIKDELEKQGLGYIIIMGDPLIGARREFLDPTEMAIFNSNVIKVLATTGVLRMLHQEIDRLVAILKEDLPLALPRLLVDTDVIRDNSDFQNPYAKAKAMAAYELTKRVAEIDTRACFIEKDREKYIPLVACAHEIAQMAAKLAEEAREIEKYSDTLARKPHSKKGEPLTKTKLMLPPTVDKKIYQRWLKASRA
ncbi:F420-dependent methylenetetrahydromethanopterin dehydrogenase [Candidatus Bathyarchaeota archaeon]|nr:F420-dependent methylenetetrahydromethanopterin dehydrogenase [Candidatus Bathyarchaeota archaeon]